MLMINELATYNVRPNFYNCYVDGHLVMAFCDPQLALKKFADEIYDLAIFDEKLTLDGKSMKGNTQLTVSFALNDCYILNTNNERVLVQELAQLVEALKHEDSKIVDEILGLKKSTKIEEDEEYSEDGMDYTDTMLDDDNDEEDNDYTPEYHQEKHYTDDWNDDWQQDLD